MLPRAQHLTLCLEQGGLEGQEPSALCPHLSLGSSQGWVCQNTNGCGVSKRGAHASTSLEAYRTASSLQLSPSRPAWNEVARNVSRNPFLTPNDFSRTQLAPGYGAGGKTLLPYLSPVPSSLHGIPACERTAPGRSQTIRWLDAGGRQTKGVQTPPGTPAKHSEAKSPRDVVGVLIKEEKKKKKKRSEVQKAFAGC